ncbi:MAG: nitroreductase family protein [Candidatus Aenigmarchaeota archaeon]|nr:nitroreductase family protein [Candidatus Aenigmarchaeota archaeon]
MDVFDAIESRVNVKVFDKRDVPEELIAQVLMAGTFAASAGDIQPWEFVVVKEKSAKTEISLACLRQRHVEDAPLLIIVCANLEKVALKFGQRGKEFYAIQDTGACIQNMLLAAHALGLGASWVHAFEEEAIKRILKLPDKIKPLGVLTIGFPLPYEKYYKTEVIPFENISWSEEYGKELPWFLKEDWKDRFALRKSIYNTVKDAEIKVPEIKIQAQDQKKKKQNGNIYNKVLDLIKRLRQRKT